MAYASKGVSYPLSRLFFLLLVAINLLHYSTAIHLKLDIPVVSDNLNSTFPVTNSY